MPFPRGLTLPGEQRQCLTSSRTSRLLKEQSCPATYPDGMTGVCLYERLGPTCHKFTFRYFDNRRLSVLYHVNTLTNTAEAIADAVQERVEAAFQDAALHERKDYFARATLPSDGSRIVDPMRAYLRSADAKAHGGKYALCLAIGPKLVCVSGVVDTLDAANEMWAERNDTSLVVACCNRLERRWEQPRYNPLYKQIGFPDTERQALWQKQREEIEKVNEKEGNYAALS